MGGTRASEAELLATMERLLVLEARDVASALTQASDLLAPALSAEKVDAFLFDPASESLVAVGTSSTPLARLQKAKGLDRLPLANGGSSVRVYVTGEPYLNGRVDEDRDEIPGIVHDLGIRSGVAVPLEIGGERRGVLYVTSTQRDFFTDADLRFLAAVARWVGVIAHRAELSTAIAQAAAEEARRAGAEEMLTILAHDMRNYLQPLQARLWIIRERARRESREDYVRDAENAVRVLERLGRMVSNLLDASRLDRDAFTLVLRPVDVVAIAHELVAAFSTRSHDIRVRAPVEAVVVGDPERIRQACENLLSNAISHSPDGAPVRMDIGVEKRADGPWVEIAVIDEGPGIPPDVLPRIFHRFARGHTSKGLGLGLYLASRIAEAHGGTLAVESPPGKGATFRLSLPVENAGEPPGW